MRISREEHQRLLNKFQMEGCLAQKGLWNLVREKVLQERGELPKEEGAVIREYKVYRKKRMREEDVSVLFLCWLLIFSVKGETGEMWWSFLGGPFGDARGPV